MTILPNSRVSGDLVQLQRTNPLHLTADGKTGPVESQTNRGFGSYLIDALNGVNDLQNTSNDIVTQSIINPDSVDPQDVTIAISEATLALNITRTVFDRAVQAYNNVINMR